MIFVTGWKLFYTEQEMKFTVEDFLSKYEQICSFLRICLHLLKKPLTENLFF